jgi:plasmid stability protein
MRATTVLSSLSIWNLELDMTSLIVRNLDEELVRKLKLRAARHSRSAEAEHRAILEAALMKTKRRSLADVLSSMPNVGLDTDFERRDESPASDVFG